MEEAPGYFRKWEGTGTHLSQRGLSAFKVIDCLERDIPTALGVPSL